MRELSTNPLEAKLLVSRQWDGAAVSLKGETSISFSLFKCAFPLCYTLCTCHAITIEINKGTCTEAQLVSMMLLEGCSLWGPHYFEICSLPHLGPKRVWIWWPSGHAAKLIFFPPRHLTMELNSEGGELLEKKGGCSFLFAWVAGYGPYWEGLLHLS